MSEFGMAVLACVAVTSLVLLILTLVGGGRGRLDRRLDSLAGKPGGDPGPADRVADFARATLPKMGAVLLPEREEERTKLQTRLVRAGLYGRQALAVYLGVKLLLIVGPAVAGAFAGLSGLVPFQTGLLAGCLAGTFGMIGPSFWLDARKASRQTTLRRAIPDALDVLVICLEGGVSLPAALRRVTGEMRTAHPVLAAELAIVELEVQLGRTPGEAFREFANRTDLEEVRNLAAVVLQSERFGSGLIRALRIHADTLRNRRVLEAEEMAQKAVVKLLFPTVIFIMPALFIAVLGPNAILVWEVFRVTQQ
jgi:tight adherence protein C